MCTWTLESYCNSNIILISLDVYDSSGLDFFYTTTPPKQEAGTLTIGSAVTPLMFIPPNADNFAIKSICSADCLGQAS